MTQPKLSPAMTTAIVDAYRHGATSHIPTVPTNPTRTYYVLRGIKTNTVAALVGRGLVIDRMVGAFRSFVLTKDGVTVARDLVGNDSEDLVSHVVYEVDEVNPHTIDTLADLALTLDEVINEADAMGLLDEDDMINDIVADAVADMAAEPMTVDEAYAILSSDTDTRFVIMNTARLVDMEKRGLVFSRNNGCITWYPTQAGTDMARSIVLADGDEFFSGTDITELTDPDVMSTMPQREIDAMHARGRKARGQRKNRARRAQRAATRSRRRGNR